VPSADLHGPKIKEARETLQKCWLDTTLVFENDGLIDPNFHFTHTQPWKLGALKLRTEAMKKSIPRLWHRIAGGKAPEKNFSYFSVAPDWSKAKSTDQVKSFVWTQLDSWQGENMKLVLSKFLVLEQLKKTPEDPELFALLAALERDVAFIRTDDYEPRALERAKWAAYTGLELDAKSPTANRVLASYFMDTPETRGDAIPQAEYALSLDPTADRTHSTLGWAYLKAGQYEKALQTASKTDYGLLQQIHTSMRNMEMANQAYLDEIQNKPSAWAYVNYASFTAYNGGDPDVAIENAKKALDLREFGMAHTVLSAAYGKKAIALQDTGKLDESIGYLDKALAEDNSNLQAHRTLAAILIKRSRESNDQAMANKAAEHMQIANQIARAQNLPIESLGDLEESSAHRAPAGVVFIHEGDPMPPPGSVQGPIVVIPKQTK
jgi:tetratricopeptide (TPR) repeat protein